jgi:hypothetical protein
MGSGKSSILKKSTLIGRSRFIQNCQEYDILGADQSGADTLSKSHTGRKWIMDNSDEAQQTKVINRILGI